MVGFCLFMLLITGIVSFTASHSLTDDISDNVNEDVPKTRDYGAMDAGVHTAMQRLFEMVLDKEDQIKLHGEEFEKELSGYEAALSRIRKYSHNTEEENKKIDQISDLYKQFKAVTDSIANSVKEKNKEAAITLLINKLPEYQDKIDEMTDALLSSHMNDMSVEGQKSVSQANRSEFLILFCVGISFLVSAVIIVLLVKKIDQATSFALNNIQKNTSTVLSVSENLADISTNLSGTSTKLATALSETASSLDEISAMIGKASENADSTKNTAAQSETKTIESRDAVNKMSESINEISHSNDEILNQIEETSKNLEEIILLIKNIGDKTKVINEIVFQTKLLSFNASVEAARAGEHGKGFSVVAEEVANLALMSGKSAQEISMLLENSVSKVESTIKETNEKIKGIVHKGKTKVDAGVVIASQCSEILSELVQNISKVASLSQEVAQASKEQSQGVGEINKALSEIDSVTQSNASSSSKLSDSASTLLSEANAMKQSVSDLSMIINGESEEQSDEFYRRTNSSAAVEKSWEAA